MDKTLELVKIIESTGVAALAVHGRSVASLLIIFYYHLRTKEERSTSPVNVDVLRRIASTVQIPVIAK